MTMNAKALPDLFNRYRDRFAAEKQALIELDGKVGDSDLGLTMAKGFAAAATALVEKAPETLADGMKTAGAAIAKAAPSTMGTLMATGFLRGAKALDRVDVMDTTALADFWAAFRDGIAQRGKAQLGDKTVLDVLHPVAETIAAQAQSGASPAEASRAAAQAAKEALEATKEMEAQHGKAAAFGEKSKGIQDAGGTVACILIEETSAAFGA